MKTKVNIMTGLLLGGLAFTGMAQAAGVEAKLSEVPLAEAKPAQHQAKVQLAILLDTSGSMSGLIEQTKTQLWRIVNTFIDAKQGGQVPFVEVALYEYGNDGLESESHWIRRITPLTRDLDLVSKELFALRTNGGSEFCGAVIQRATADLDWDPSPDVYKAVFVAGNEPFTQGPVDPSQACKNAVGKGVIVNTIHCGGEQQGVAGGWKSGALLADGKFLIIDHNQAVVHVDAPQDAEIVKLNGQLNKTYIGFGKSGDERFRMQSEQDSNAFDAAESGAHVNRVISKASVNYSNSNWDLVDACKEEDFDLGKVKEAELPEEMRDLDAAGRKEYVAKKQAAREAIQQKIQKLNKDRQEFVEKKLKEMGDGADNTLDKVVVNTVREQAGKKGYRFGE